MTPTMSKKKDKPDRHQNPGLTVRFSQEVFAAIVEAARQQRRKKTDMIRLLVEDALVQLGFLPADQNSPDLP